MRTSGALNAGLPFRPSLSFNGRFSTPLRSAAYGRVQVYVNVGFYEDSFVKMIAGSGTPHEDGYRGMSACSRFRPGSEVGV